MKLWHVYKTEGQFGYDCSHAFAIRAETAVKARLLAAEAAGDEGPAVWLDAEKTTCNELTPDGISAVIVHDFNAG